MADTTEGEKQNTDLVDCDDRMCVALQNPKTPEEIKVALEHWRDHSFLSGCSHGC